MVALNAGGVEVRMLGLISRPLLPRSKPPSYLVRLAHGGEWWLRVGWPGGWYARWGWGPADGVPTAVGAGQVNRARIKTQERKKRRSVLETDLEIRDTTACRI